MPLHIVLANKIYFLLLKIETLKYYLSQIQGFIYSSKLKKKCNLGHISSNGVITDFAFHFNQM